MKSVAKLRAAGFTITESTKAFNCTVVRSKKRFFYFNPRFALNALDVCEKMEEANLTPEGDYCFIIAGVYISDAVELPYRIVTEEQQAALEEKYFHREETQRAADLSHKALVDTVDSILET